MSYSQPRGYRLPSTLSLTMLSRRLEQLGWPLWRREVVSTLASVAHQLALADDHDEVYQRLSHDQVRGADLRLTQGASLVQRAAEFLDAAHGLMSMPSAIPVSPSIDLRCRLQFVDDAEDPERQWTYALFGTQRLVLEEAFLAMDYVEAYPIQPVDAADTEVPVREATWARVLAPYARFTPLSVSAPEPQVYFDIYESVYHDGLADDQLARQGKVTLRAVSQEFARLTGVDQDAACSRLMTQASD